MLRPRLQSFCILWPILTASLFSSFSDEVVKTLLLLVSRCSAEIFVVSLSGFLAREERMEPLYFIIIINLIWFSLLDTWVSSFLHHYRQCWLVHPSNKYLKWNYGIICKMLGLFNYIQTFFNCSNTPIHLIAICMRLPVALSLLISYGWHYSFWNLSIKVYVP